MGRLLAALIADSGTVPAANPANVANLDLAPLPIFADSQVSQGLQPARAAVTPSLNIFPHYKKAQDSQLASAAEKCARLLAAIRAAHLPDALIGAADAKSDELAALSDAGIHAYVSMLADDAQRRAGHVPEGDTAMLLCRHCGLVFVHPAIAAAMHVVNGVPQSLGCPWCFIRKAGLYIPRPAVTCGTCQHFIRDTVNPPGGMGSCALGVATKPPKYPFTTQHCGQWRPREGTP